MLFKTETLSSSLLYQRLTPYGLIFFLLLVIYWGSFHTGWQLDDRPNIIDNPGLCIDDLMPESLWGTFFANQGKAPALFRPLSCLTLALNWYAGRDNPFGYHVVNLGFHMATAWALYVLIIQLLAILYKDGRRDPSWIQNVALLTTVLWAANPIQTQAVTYIVQRMAIMAALFYVLGMLYYVYARTAQTSGKRWMYGATCFLCLVCGIGSKENDVLLPVSLALVEWIFFRRGSLSFFVRPKVLLVATTVVFGSLFVVYLTLGRPTQYILTGYADRPFTMMERLMTQPRILLGYLSQIFFPLPERLSIAHDVTLSTSFFQPWTTLPAMAMILAAMAGAVVKARQYPLISFAVLFYLLNHVVESTLLPLELVFEHRNYLPSLFLFLPIVSVFYDMFLRLRGYSHILNAGAIGIVIVIIIGLGFFTHTRNKAWATPESLWRDAALKAPNSIRPLVTLGIQLAWRDNPTPANYRHALVLFQRSLELSQNQKKEQSDILGNMASVYSFQGNNTKAIELYHQALSIAPGFHKNRSDLVNVLVMDGRFEEAKQQSQNLILATPDNPDYFNVLGFILLLQGKNEAALTQFQAAMKKGLRSASLLLNLGVALTRTDYWERGHWFLKQAIKQAPKDPIPVFAMIENRILAGDNASAKDQAEKLLNIMPASTIVETLNALPGNYRFAPIPIKIIQPVLADVMADELKRLDLITDDANSLYSK